MNTAAAATLHKSLATTIHRGATLLTSDGYTVAATARPAIYIVTKPVDCPVNAGDKASYTVDVAGGTCDCPAYVALGNCKHLIAVTAEVAKALAPVGPMLPEPFAIAVVAVPEAKVSKVGRYGSDAWKASVARDFC